MPHAQVGDASIYYETHGAGPALLFCHGLGGNHLSWWQQVPYFRERYRCIVLSHRGFFPSTRCAPIPTIDALTDDLTAVIDDMGLPDVRLVGQSMGGWPCLAYALRHPSRVKALVMADTTGPLTNPALKRIFQANERENPRQELAARGIAAAAGERMQRGQPAIEFLYRAIGALSADLDKDALFNALAQSRVVPAERISALEAPLLCIAGAEDVTIPPAAVELVASLVPGARYVCVPRAGHSVYFERPEEFNRIVDSFLHSVDGTE